ncbi:hypothetical protein EDB81DRAFT_831747 [Dactylonectria macrodidyma]|uniref:Uncharacterized protein n=1 Tax=Dactylonectria macrodidyma TaxID=307937 RepID=A0A9P9D0N5_9HYPO|nr:hypothetical protein EDB81DRAFT_831747 [Dactylonectria macrodidyma]
MRSFVISLCATVLASSVSAFDICRALRCIEPSDSPAVLVTLQVPAENRLYEPTIRVDLDESDEVCDPSRVQMFGQSLPIDEDGRGSGTLFAMPNLSITANWEFSCATPKNASTEHRLHFAISSIDGEEVPETGFVTRFRQIWPIVFTSVESSALAKDPEYSRGTLHYGPEGRRQTTLSNEL